jgi:hypothetical protein
LTHSSSLPPSDSPLTTVFLGQYVSKLMQETITYLKLPYETLAHEMSVPEMVLRDAVEGKMGLTRGQWVKLGRLLGLPTTYILRPGVRDGMPCWEICFPPVSLGTSKT